MGRALTRDTGAGLSRSRHQWGTLQTVHFRSPVPLHCAQVASPRSKLVAACRASQENQTADTSSGNQY